MTPPIHYFYEITSKTEECTTPPPDPKIDPCRIQIKSAPETPIFTLVRQGDKFTVSKEDQSQVSRYYHSYQPPHQKLSEFIFLKKKFYDIFGDIENPTDIAKKIFIINGTEEERLRAVNGYINMLANFISHGTLSPDNAPMKSLLESSLQSAIYTSADPTMGILVRNLLTQLTTNGKLSAESKKRARWLLGINQAREEFWRFMKPEMDKSAALGDGLKASSSLILTFLFANHILDEGGSDKALKLLFHEKIKEAAKIHHQVMSKLDPDYDIEKNFYVYLAGILVQLKLAVNLSNGNQEKFLRRANFAISKYMKEIPKETQRLLPLAPPEQALKVSLKTKYGNTPERKKALSIILKHIKIGTKGGAPSFEVPMGDIDGELRGWVASLPDTDKKGKATEAILYLLKALFERGEKMEVYWNKSSQEIDNFFGSESFGKSLLGGKNNKVLQDLIVWARQEAKKHQVDLTPDTTPPVPLRKWTLMGELGVGVAGVGTGFIPWQDPNQGYYGQGALFILGGSGLGAAGGNLISYAADADEYAWVYDVSGAIIGGVLAGVIYGFAAQKPEPPGSGPPVGDPGQRFPVDPYGP